jgi:MFS family permease
VPRALRPVVATAALAVSAAYMLGAVVLSLGADLVTQLLGSRADPLVSGVVLAVSSVTIAVVAIATRALRPHVTLPLGAAATGAGLALLLAASATRSLPLVLAGMLVGGAGYSLEFAGGVGIAATRAPAEHRVGVVSAVYLVAYAAQGVTALGLGAVATTFGLTIAFAVALPVVAAVAVVGALAVTVRPRATGAGPQGEPA